MYAKIDVLVTSPQIFFILLIKRQYVSFIFRTCNGTGLCLVFVRDRAAKRELKLLNVLLMVKSTLWKTLFGKEADKVCQNQCFGSGWIRIQIAAWIRIRIR